jgi:SAM-dependent methyltransferase
MEEKLYEYDDLIANHYNNEAQKHGLSSSSTMPDNMIRKKETEAVIHFLKETIEYFSSFGYSKKIEILEIGCGNGYLFSQLGPSFPKVNFTGVESNEEMFELAKSRFSESKNVTIAKEDIRNKGFINDRKFDIIISQRVFINILDRNDQEVALKNVISALRAKTKNHPGGRIIAIESFIEPLENLNKARTELDLPPTKPQYHNLYLDNSFFQVKELRLYQSSNTTYLSPNFLSTNYFIARVLYPLLKGDKSISRNSELVNFFVSALKENIGDYAPLKVYTFVKV